MLPVLTADPGVRYVGQDQTLVGRRQRGKRRWTMDALHQR